MCAVFIRKVECALAVVLCGNGHQHIAGECPAFFVGVLFVDDIAVHALGRIRLNVIDVDGLAGFDLNLLKFIAGLLAFSIGLIHTEGERLVLELGIELAAVDGLLYMQDRRTGGCVRVGERRGVDGFVVLGIGDLCLDGVVLFDDVDGGRYILRIVDPTLGVGRGLLMDGVVIGISDHVLGERTVYAFELCGSVAGDGNATCLEFRRIFLRRSGKGELGIFGSIGTFDRLAYIEAELPGLELVVNREGDAGTRRACIGNGTDDRLMPQPLSCFVCGFKFFDGLGGRRRGIEEYVGSLVGNLISFRRLGFFNEIERSRGKRLLLSAECRDAVGIGRCVADLGFLTRYLVNGGELELCALKGLRSVVLSNLFNRQAIAHGICTGIRFGDRPAGGVGFLGCRHARKRAAVGNRYILSDNSDRGALIGDGELLGIGNTEGEDRGFLAIDRFVLETVGAAGGDIGIAGIDDLE